MNPLWFIALALATYRLSRMLAFEKGPADVFIRWRGWVCDWSGNKGAACELATCPLCLSVWVGWLMACAIATTPLEIFVIGLAFSGVTTALIRTEI